MNKLILGHAGDLDKLGGPDAFRKLFAGGELRPPMPVFQPPALRIKKLHADARLPTYETKFAAGADLFACIQPDENNDTFITIAPGDRRVIPTGLAFEIPPGLEVQIRPRSGLALKFGITVLNAPGTIDADYRGEVGVILHNLSFKIYGVRHGDRIAQMVIAPAMRLSFQEVAELTPSDRTGGFGSTGV